MNHKPALDLQTVVLLAQSAEDAFDRCVTLALQKTRASTVMLLLHRTESNELEIVAGAGQLSELALGRRLSAGMGLAWHVMATAQPYLVEEAYARPDAYFLAGQARHGMYLGVPLLSPEGQMLGVLSADTTDSPEVLDEADAQLLLLLGQAAGVAYGRWKALDDARRSAQQYQQLAHLSAQLETLSDPDDIAREALGVLLALSGFTVGAVMEVNGDGLTHLRMVQGDPAAADLLRPLLSEPHEPRGMIAEVMTHQRSIALPDYLAYPCARPEITRLRSALAAPLCNNGKVVGVIGLLNLDAVRGIPAELSSLLDMVAARVNRAQERISNFTQMREMREAALRAVGRMLEGRDGETFGHTDRVTALSLRLGQVMELDAEALQHLRWGAYLHDIGKVTLGDDILLKAGPLTTEERQRMQKHVIVGDHLLRDEGLVPREVREVVRFHHERWDGGGYPEGLGGDTIPLLARIFSVVDVYDALVSERPYKSAWTHEQALEELRRGAGSQFDPRVLVAFESLFT